jgi:hypothetical protein
MTTAPACSGIWDDWTDCDATCDPNGDKSIVTGKQKRIYTMTNPTSNPKTIETDAICTKTCPINCTGYYNDWEKCEANCNENQKTSEGEKKRTFTITRQHSNGGIACSEKSTDTEKCVKTCPVNCIGKWSDWSACEATTPCTGKDPFNKGIRKRTYIITRPESDGGNSCGIENGKVETEECKKECNVDSMFFYMTVAFGSFLALLLLIGIAYFYYTSRKASNIASEIEAAKAAGIPVARAVGRR